jgi:hypothetical protein
MKTRTTARIARLAAAAGIALAIGAGSTAAAHAEELSTDLVLYAEVQSDGLCPTWDERDPDCQARPTTQSIRNVAIKTSLSVEATESTEGREDKHQDTIEILIFS